MRTELFIAALGVHEAFITAQAAVIRKNLNALADILDGGKGRPSPTAARAAWQTFFLVVPVVSSAFASIDRLFAGFGRESLGWVLIDEAGQAAPQLAAGAIWRARRTVVVGNREAWRMLKYFDTLAEALPVWPPDHARLR